VVDVGSEWIYADTLARGGVLYRDVVYWFGPFTPYFEAGFFRLFDSSFQTLVLAGVVGSIGAFAALLTALRRGTDRRSALLWAAIAVPALFFMPYSGGSILGMGHRMWHAATFSLLAGAVVSRRDFAQRPALAALAGVLCALSGLCRTEWGLATLGACVLGVILRSPRAGKPWKSAFILGGVAVLSWGAVVGLFVLWAGPESVLKDSQLLLAGLPPETRRFLWKFSGFSQPGRGIATLAYSAALWIGVLLLLPLAGSPPSAPARRRKRLLLLAACAAALLLSWLAGASIGGAALSAAPVVALAALAVGVGGRAGALATPLVVFGALGLLLSFRRLLDIQDAGYVAPPILFTTVCAAMLVRLVVLGHLRGGERRATARNARRVLILVCVFFFVSRARHYLADDRVPLAGTGHALSASPRLAGEIAGLVRSIESLTRREDGLVVVPEGAVLNYLTGRPNPIRYKLLIPGYLTPRNEPDVLRALQRDPPRAIVIWSGPTEEYGYRFFGEDYGLRIRQWIEERYDFVAFPESRLRVEGGATRLAILRPGAQPGTAPIVR
jgi:hypothetical protein